MARAYKIGEAAALLNLKTYVLRFWETEFPDIVPQRTEKGQRLYTQEHLALLERIRYLLHDRGLTINGARKALAEEKERGIASVFAPAENSAPGCPGNTGSSRAGACERIAPHTDAHPENELDAQNVSQYTLPGVARAFPEKDASGACRDFGGDSRLYRSREEELAPEDPRVLPLFTIARSLVQAERAAEGFAPAGAGQKTHEFTPPPEGGDNFIHAGASGPGGATLPMEKTMLDALAARDVALKTLAEHRAHARENTRGILANLREIAALLRG